ncbi:Tol-Pal system beta propeller repeat protein TolB [Pseudomaricurvus sp. HS19]|uniref:Tol-Pal system beta propeller repeat protein TolB n=1 Tax=Pseudomaricurvus sp. HS19 TaxID=2692626 RepID=UPI00136E4D63|nr:Tol-Pal system beta propeller repeat protein TolB [Pseudomaricurvus sp. HS19]MYM65026.1 Tol-Pal system protein TolB [Pseudomaricurvus sp. HS19]
MIFYRAVRQWLAVALMVVAAQAQAELTIEITQGVDNPTAIAVVPTGWTGGALPEDVAAIAAADLRRSGQFRPIAREDMLQWPRFGDQVFYRDWRVLGSDYVVLSRLNPVPGGGYSLDFELYDVLSQRKVLQRNVQAGPQGLRDLAHAMADAIYEAITGIRGAFSTKMLYVEAFGNKRYRLMLADVDGAREKELLKSSQPIVSPSWSPDGKQVVYVSFETTRPAIFRQVLATGERQQLTNFRGLNGAPVFSPDGRKVAMVLSKDGNPEIYTLDLATRVFTRHTNHFAIDTEPAWSNDGKSLIFTSDRGGKPQIYQVTLASGRVERLTFDGDYNARARFTPDGKSLVMVHRYNGVFHIATQDLESGMIRVLTQTDLDESPSIAPNGAMLLYATKDRSKGILAAVSLDAGVKFRLPSKQGDVREPAWSPYFTKR